MICMYLVTKLCTDIIIHTHFCSANANTTMTNEVGSFLFYLWPRSGWHIRSRLQKCIEVDTSLVEQNPSLLQEVPEHSMVKLVWRRHDSAKAKLSRLYHSRYSIENTVDIIIRTKPFQTLWKDLRITLSFNVNFAQVWCIRRSSADVIGYV